MASGQAKSSPLLIACALGPETSALRRQLGPDYTYLTTGIGSRLCRKTLARKLSSNPPRTLVFAGTAGQLNPALPMGTVLCPRQWRKPESAPLSCTAEIWSLLPRDLKVELGLTVSRPVVRSVTRLELHRRFGASICDMEGATALAVAQESQVAAICIKVISDTAESGLVGFWRHFGENLNQLADVLKTVLPLVE